MQEGAIFKAYRITPLQFTLKTVATAESNISKWAKGGAGIVEKAAANVTRELLKNYRPRAWFLKQERELYVLFRAKRKRGLKVSTFLLYVTMASLIKKLYPDDCWAETFIPSWRFGKWAKKFLVATRRRSNSKNQSIEERLPKIQRFHKSLRGLMENPPPAYRGSKRAVAEGSVEMHRRGQANLEEWDRGVQVERGTRTPTISTAGFLWTEVLTWTRCVHEFSTSICMYLVHVSFILSDIHCIALLLYALCGLLFFRTFVRFKFWRVTRFEFVTGVVLPLFGRTGSSCHYFVVVFHSFVSPVF